MTMNVAKGSHAQVDLDALLDDPFLLRAEFDAIIATSWPDPPRNPPAPRKAPPVLAPEARVPGPPFHTSGSPRAADMVPPGPTPPRRGRSPPRTKARNHLSGTASSAAAPPKPKNR